jgi:hypothetical protein
MKQCPRCHQTYSDDALNFCLEDGELLTAFSREPPPTRYADDAPPTVLLNEARVTNPTNWPASPASSSPPTPWQPQPLNLQNQMFGSPSSAPSRDQTLPTISLILGILSVALICCYGGIWLGLPAAILGFLGMRNADNDAARYSGRGMAIAGMVLGVMSMLGTLLVAFFAIIAS